MANGIDTDLIEDKAKRVSDGINTVGNVLLSVGVGAQVIPVVGQIVGIASAVAGSILKIIAANQSQGSVQVNLIQFAQNEQKVYSGAIKNGYSPDEVVTAIVAHREGWYTHQFTMWEEQGLIVKDKEEFLAMPYPWETEQIYIDTNGNQHKMGGNQFKNANVGIPLGAIAGFIIIYFLSKE